MTKQQHAKPDVGFRQSRRRKLFVRANYQAAQLHRWRKPMRLMPTSFGFAVRFVRRAVFVDHATVNTQQVQQLVLVRPC
jgi:hypothetical protein